MAETNESRFHLSQKWKDRAFIGLVTLASATTAGVATYGYHTYTFHAELKKKEHTLEDHRSNGIQNCEILAKKKADIQINKLPVKKVDGFFQKPKIAAPTQEKLKECKANNIALAKEAYEAFANKTQYKKILSTAFAAAWIGLMALSAAKRRRATPKEDRRPFLPIAMK